MEENNRTKTVEDFLLDPQRVIFEQLTEFQKAVDILTPFMENIDFETLTTLKGEDGKTPVRGVDYFTDEDLDTFETFIINQMPKVDIDYPSVATIESFIAEQVAKIPRIKGDKGDRGTKGEDGKNGSPDTGTEIITKIQSVKDKNKKLQIDDIRGLKSKIELLNITADGLAELKNYIENMPVVIPTGTNSGGTGGGIQTLTADGSIDIDSSDPENLIISLVNDADSPGNSKYYGTNGSGTKGFFDLPSAVEWGDITGTLSDQTDLQSALDGKVGEAGVRSTPLTGLSVSGSNITSTDTVLQALGKAQNQINSLVGGVNYQGTWNANTNSPSLASGVGTKGYYYVVSVAGSTNLDGITDWKLGDWAIFNGTAWEKVDNTDAVISVNGYTGIITLVKGDIGLGNVDNTSDLNKPISTATQTALDLKAPLASPTFTGNVTVPTIKITGGSPGLGKVLTSDADGDGTWETPSSGSSFWNSVAGSPVRASNTTFTVTGDYTSLFAKGMILKWTESSTVRVAMVAIPSTYSAPDTTVTIIGDTMASIDADSLKYCLIGVEAFQKNFAVAGTIGATGTNVANAYYATEPMRVIGADLQVGTAGTTNSTTIDINKGGTTMFTTKPTLATTVATSPTPFTADSATSLALADKVTIDIDAVQTTAAVDLYVNLYVFPTRYLNL